MLCPVRSTKASIVAVGGESETADRGALAVEDVLAFSSNVFSRIHIGRAPDVGSTACAADQVRVLRHVDRAARSLGPREAPVECEQCGVQCLGERHI